jgi:hypothetical protein
LQRRADNYFSLWLSSTPFSNGAGKWHCPVGLLNIRALFQQVLKYTKYVNLATTPVYYVINSTGLLFRFV